MDEVAFEKDITSVYVEPIGEKGGLRRNSTRQAYTGASPSVSKNNEKPVPHYLRGSTNSCHDFCKYGIKHELEIKKRHPVRPKFPGNNGIPGTEQRKGKVLMPQGGRKRLELKLEASQPKHEMSDKREVTIEHSDLPPEKIIQLSEMPVTVTEGSTEESSSVEAKSPLSNMTSIESLEHTPANQAEGLSEEPLIINVVSSLPNLESNASDDHKQACSAGLYDHSANMKIDAPSAIQNQVERVSSDSPEADLKLLSPIQKSTESDKHMAADLARQAPRNVAKQSLIQKSIASARRTGAIHASRSPKEHVSMKLRSPLSVQKGTVSAEHITVDEAERIFEEHNQMSSSGDRKKREVTKPKTAQKKAEISSRPKVIKQKNFDVSGEPKNKMIKGKSASPVMKISKSAMPTNTQQRSVSSNKNSVATVTPRITKKKALSPSKKIGVRVDPVNSAMLSPVARSTLPSASSGGISGQRNQDKKKTRSPGQMETREVTRPVLTSVSHKPSFSRVSSLQLRKYRSMKPASPVKNEAKARKMNHSIERVKEKTLHVIEQQPKTEDLKSIKQEPGKHKSHPSSQTSSPDTSFSPSPFVLSHEKEENEDCESTLSEASESGLDKQGTERSKPSHFSKGEDKRKHRRTPSVRSGDKVPSPQKLTFHRGKVVNPLSEDNTPRRLRFRPAKVVSANQSGKDVGRRSFRKRRDSSTAISATPVAEAPSVVLRHQDVQDRKEIQALFNDVIEETASKLVETRKSKVKALVGAFETVISLQESKESHQ